MMLYWTTRNLKPWIRKWTNFSQCYKNILPVRSPSPFILAETFTYIDYYLLMIVMHRQNSVRDNAIPSHRSVSSISTSVSSIPSTVSSNGEYVYDIFYARPSTMTEKVAAAHMAIVTGLPIEKDDDDEYSSGSEIEDEADEDSNGMLISFNPLYTFSHMLTLACSFSFYFLRSGGLL